MPRKTNSGSRRPIEIFKKSKMIRIEFPKLLAWFQTPQTVSRPSRPFPDRPDPISSLTELLSTHLRNWCLSNPHSLLNRARRAQRKFLAWFQTPHTVSRPSRPNFQPHRTVEHTSQNKFLSNPQSLLNRARRAQRQLSGLVPDTSYRFQTVQ